MKITKQQLTQIINEEIKAALEEGWRDMIPKFKFTTTAKMKADARARGRQKSSDEALRGMLDDEKQKVAEIAAALGGYEDLIEILANVNYDQNYASKADQLKQKLMDLVEQQGLSGLYFAKALLAQAYDEVGHDASFFVTALDNKIDNLARKRNVLPAEDTPELDLYYKILQNPKILL